MLDAMIASALKNLLNTQSNMRKRASVEERRDQQSDQFLRGRQIAYMIYEYFRATEAYATLQGLADVVSTTLQNDDVHDFDVRWDHALLSVSEMPSDHPRRIVQIEAQLWNVMALYDQEVARKMRHGTVDN